MARLSEIAAITQAAAVAPRYTARHAIDYFPHPMPGPKRVGRAHQRFFYQRGFNIVHCQQYTDSTTNQFYMRLKLAADLDEGPIVDQDIERVSHEDAEEDLQQ